MTINSQKQDMNRENSNFSQDDLIKTEYLDIDFKGSNSKKFNLNRRQFVKGGSFLGVMAGASALLPFSKQSQNFKAAASLGNDYEEYTAENVIYSQCEHCNTNCTLKAVMVPSKGTSPATSIIRKLAGNPYSPLNSEPYNQLPYDTDPDLAVKGTGDVRTDGRAFAGGRICLKGQAGIQTAFDATRLRQPLKRVGPRGSNEWKTITWEEALNEIYGGSADLGTPGLKDIWAYADKDTVMADWDLVKDGQMTQAAFDAKYADTLIDTNHPDFGPKANQIVSMAGDRRDFIHDRFWNKSLGSLNAHDHAGVCGISGVFGNIRSFITGSPKKRMYNDVDHSDFTIVWGTDPFVANKGPTWLAPKFINAIKRGMKMVVVDPKFTNAAEKADQWIPIKPGTDMGLIFGMAQWMIANERIDYNYLTNPNKKVAQANGEPSWSDSSYLVNLDHPNKPKLRGKDIGFTDEDVANNFVCIDAVTGQPTPHTLATKGTLEVTTKVEGINVKSVFTLYKERVFEKTIEEYAEIAGISPDTIIDLAREFTSHGKKAGIISYRGPAMRSNGFNNIRALTSLNHLIGNYDWKGGSISAGARFKPFGGEYDLKAMPGAYAPWGIKTDRSQIAYEATSLFKRDGYPAKRPWFPLANKIIHDVIPSAAEGYPYPIKALFIERISPILSFPAGSRQAEILKDTSAIPLLVVHDIVMSETALLADFVLPDLSYLERFGTDSIYPNQPLNVSMFRQPLTRVFPEPVSTEDVYIRLGKMMNLPGCGDNAFPDGSSLHSSTDFYVKMIANIAHDQEPVPDASAREMEIFRKARENALGEAFNYDEWKSAVTDAQWPKVVYVLNRGGRFEAKEGNGYEGDYIKHKFGEQVIFYDENTAKNKHPYTGENFSGIPWMDPLTFYNGEEVNYDGYPLQFINWKAPHIGTHRNTGAIWLREVDPMQAVWMHTSDAKGRGITDGDEINIKTKEGVTKAIVKVTELIRPGVVGAHYNYGHTSYGAKVVTIDGKKTSELPEYGHAAWMRGERLLGYAKGRTVGFSVNDMQALDNSYSNGAILDWIGGGASQLDIHVEIEKA